MSGPILVTGASGLLGGMLLWQWRQVPQGLVALVRRRDQLPDGAWPGVTLVEADLGDPEALARALESVRPGLVVNCAALTNVDLCERQPELAMALNARAPGVVAALAARLGAGLVQIASDSVYAQGPGPHPETAAGGELSVYARSKLAGEAAALAAHPGALVLRTCIVGLNANPARSSLAEWILANLAAGQAINGFSNVNFSPLFTASLAPAIAAGVAAGLRGVYNLGCAQGLSKYDFARRLARAFGHDEGLVRPARLDQAGLAAPRPLDPVLDSARFAAEAAWLLPDIAGEVERLARFARGGELAQFRRFGGWA